jgi:RNA polymerase sigma factor, sigma-70 family
VFDPIVVEATGALPVPGSAKKAEPRRRLPLPLPALEPGPNDIGELYVRHWTLLLHIGSRKFHVPESDAEALIQEIFLSLMNTITKVENVRAWLIAAMCNASRHYWRVQARTEGLPEDFDEHTSSNDIAEEMAMFITMRQALEYLKPPCRETLHQHYYEGFSANEVATSRKTTSGYAEKLIHNCLKRVREIYFSITAVKR